MELSAEVLRETLKGLKVDSRPDEKRSKPRVALRRKVTLYCRAAGQEAKAAEVWVTDISSGGIGLQLDRPMPTGEKFVVQPPDVYGKCLSLLCTVRNARQRTQGVWIIGSTFAEVIPATPRETPAKAAPQPAEPVVRAAPTPPTDGDELVDRIRAAIFD